MKETILFSPLGMTDPVRFFHDGAMLNIIRNYKPDKVYLYMSKEICNIHRKTNEYLYCIERLAELLDKKIDVHIIERPDLEDVQIFDGFIAEFTDLLVRIHTENPGSRILLNVSSGSPAMKSSLQILSLTLNFNVIPIQVSSPNKSSNPRNDDEKNATPEELWELNESNDGNDNRCIESSANNLLREFKKQTLIRLINAYDYAAACELAAGDDTLPKPFIELLSAANSRLKLKYFHTFTVFNKYDYKASFSAGKDIEEIFEYLLLLNIKTEKQEYADFVRAITPVTVKLFELYLKTKCSVDISDYTTEGEWDKQKLQGTRVLDCLERKYTGSNRSFNYGIVYSDGLCCLIKEFSANQADVKLANDIRKKIEQGIRNSAAHSIMSVTDDIVRKSTGFSSDEIMRMLYDMLKICGADVPAEPLRVYDEMNKFIIDKLS